MLNFTIRLANRLRESYSDFIYFSKSYVSSLFKRDRKLSKHELEEVYSSMAKALKSSIPIHDRLVHIANSKIAAGRSKKAEVYFDIAQKVRDPRSSTPISNAFKPYIPKADYQLMSRSEFDRTLKESLPHIQELTNIQSKLNAQNLKLRLSVFYNFIFPFMLFAFIDYYYNFFAGPFGYGSNTRDPFYVFWHGVNQFFCYFDSIIIILFALYLLFYFRTRDNHPIGLRAFCDYLPFFKSYSQGQLIGALVSVSVSIDISTGTPLPKIVRGLVRFSTKYVGANLEQMAREIERTNFSNALSVIKMLPKDLVEILNLRISESAKDSKLTDAALDSIERVLLVQARYLKYITIVGFIYQLSVFMIPSFAANNFIMNKSQF